jgi:hypothetical protein
MKQFQKFGVAAAVASVATGAVATQQSTSEVGDLAIVPYYSVLDGTNTGIHVINTSGSTQVIKVRLRRATDSKDALDFNVVMSPYDEWTANIVAGGENGVQVRTADTSCTVPQFAGEGTVKTADMPATYAEGATEGYVEIIAMAQTATELEPIAVSAEHDATGVPADCADVRLNFYRVAATNVGDATVYGTHTSSLTSNGVVKTATSAGAPADNLSSFVDSDNPLKVSFMLTDPMGGFEAGDNAVHVEDFSESAMMTNQQPLAFSNDGLLKFDPINFELPNLAFGAYVSSTGARAVDAAMTDGSMMTDLQAALATEAVLNDWAAMDTDDGSVHADWVVTLPGQYTMNNPICDMYRDYSDSSASAVAACSSTAAAAYSADHDQLPLLLATATIEAGTGALLGYTSNLLLWDREEQPQIIETEDPTEEPPGLGFSPNGTADEDDPTNVPLYLPYEVNVLAFGNAEGDTAVESDVKLTVTGLTAEKGWGRLAIQSTNADPMIWRLDGTDDQEVSASVGYTGGFLSAGSTDVAVVGMAVWQRSFSSQAGNNYGRMVEHSKTSIGS